MEAELALPASDLKIASGRPQPQVPGRLGGDLKTPGPSAAPRAKWRGEEGGRRIAASFPTALGRVENPSNLELERTQRQESVRLDP